MSTGYLTLQDLRDFVASTADRDGSIKVGVLDHFGDMHLMTAMPEIAKAREAYKHSPKKNYVIFERVDVPPEPT